jgi:hypothetical protein
MASRNNIVSIKDFFTTATFNFHEPRDVLKNWKLMF